MKNLVKDGSSGSKSESRPKQLPVVRKSNFCLLCQSLVKKFSEHVEYKHPETDLGQSLKNVSGSTTMRRSLKTKITDPVRKKWNAIYNKKVVNYNYEQNLLNIDSKSEQITVKRRNKSDVPNVSCDHCEGFYRRDKLSTHLKSCQPFIEYSKNNKSNPIQALKCHSSNILPDIKSVSGAFTNEILKNKKMSKVLEVAIGDPLIMKFGSDFHKSRRAKSDQEYVMRVIRDVSRLFILMREKNPSLRCFRDILNPVHYEAVCDAILVMGNYDPVTGSVQIPSIAYRLSSLLKEIGALAKSELLSSMYALGGEIDRHPIMMIDDFLEIMSNRWKSSVGRIFTKSEKKLCVIRTDKMALEGDIVKLAGYIEGRYREVVHKLRTCTDKSKHYDFLVHMLVVHSMLLIRRRPIDFKHASLIHYTNIDKHDELLEMSKGYDLTAENLEDCKRFHIFYVPGKNLQIVPIVFLPIMKELCDVLISFREAVGIKSNLLFSLSQDGSIQPTESIKLLKKRVTSLERPDDLTGNGLRHQAATFSRLQSAHPQYQDYLASTLGHTLAVHKKHYELPMGILQKIIVCPILHKIMTSDKDNKIGSKLDKLPKSDDAGKFKHVKKSKITIEHSDESEEEYGSESSVCVEKKGKKSKETAIEHWSESEDNYDSGSSAYVEKKAKKNKVTAISYSNESEDDDGSESSKSVKKEGKETAIEHSSESEEDDGSESSKSVKKEDKMGKETPIEHSSESEDDYESDLSVYVEKKAKKNKVTDISYLDESEDDDGSESSEKKGKKNKRRGTYIEHSDESEDGDSHESSPKLKPTREVPISKNTKRRKRVMRIKSDESENNMDCGSSQDVLVGSDPTFPSNVSIKSEKVIFSENHSTFTSSSSSSSSSSTTYSSFSLMNKDETGEVKKKCTRTRWSMEEQAMVLTEFGQMILKKQVPTRGDIVDFMKKTPELQKTRSVEQVLMFVRNYALRKQQNVTGTVKEFLKNCKTKE